MSFHLLSVQKRVLAVLRSADKSGYFRKHTFPIKACERSISIAARNILCDKVLLISHTCKLRQMRYGEHLLSARDIIQLFSHYLRGFAADTRIDLIENHSRKAEARRQTVFKGKHKAGKFAAGDYLGERARRLT